MDSMTAHEILTKSLLKIKRRHSILEYVWKRMTFKPGTPYNKEEVKALILEWKMKYEGE